MAFKNNKRNSFRVTDHIHLYAIPRSEDEVAEIENNFEAYRMRSCLNTHFSHQKETRVPKLKVIKSRDPELGAYLQYLERQIQQLAQLISSNSIDHEESRSEMIPVNLSASGMRFFFDEPVVVGQRMELLFWLLPDELTVLAIAKVIRIDDEDGRNSLSVQFETIHEEDREAIIRHLVRVQQLDIQERKAG